ncbi:hypothetical protein V6U89_16780 [Micromonospora sp. CPCC 206171]|uniref:hypothetical protein n=1 Tax=Micromonospora sp. CPCC 206171 TaxID=3122405 RepID=UPI002FF33271
MGWTGRVDAADFSEDRHVHRPDPGARHRCLDGRRSVDLDGRRLCAGRRREASTAPAPPTTATVSLTTSFASLGAPKCTAGPIQWSAVPISVPAGPGDGGPVNATQPPYEFSPSGDRCVLQYSFTDLRPGRSRLGVAAGVATGVCEADLKAGLTFVTVTAGSCSVQP